MPETHSDTTAAWSLQGDALTCTVVLADGRLTWRMQGPAGLATRPAALGALTVDGRQPIWRRALGTSEQAGPDGVRTLTLEVEDATGALRLTQHLQVFPGRPFARLWAELTNAGTAPVAIGDCAFLALEAPAAPAILFHVDQFSWVYRRDFFTLHEAQIWPGRTPIEVRMGSFPSHHNGPTSCAWFALRPGATGDPPEGPPVVADGLVCGVEFNGKSRLRAWAEPGATHVESRIDALAHVLAPGAAFAIPAVFLGQYHGDWDEAGYATQRFAEAHVHPPMPDERYPWAQYNSWKYGQAIDEAQQLAVIDRCAELGIEVVVLDLGWARTIGDWRPNPQKFPRGLAPIAERARSYGMRFGVHMALAQCAPDAPIAHEHPEWRTYIGDDYFGAAPLCLAHHPCRDWVIAQMLRLIDEEGVDYIIQDGEDMVKLCDRADHSHAPGDSNYAGSTQGIDVVIETVRRARPHVVLENCEDGGCMMTYKMARLYHTSITVDNIATYATRQGIYGASYPFSPRYSVRYMEDDPTPYTLRSAIFGGPLILMQRITEWDERQMADTKAAVVQYKELRTLVRDAKIIHLLPPRANVDRVGYGWDAIQALAPDRSRSAVMVYRALGGPPERAIHPRGLDPAAIYRVRLADRGEREALSGAALERDGVALALAELDSEIIWLERQS
ncbi:MAG TPA: alpha-galactosidase [Roseiflexaceae bacterium]|nr:alpha-galactosidase [Roseiflexaceae bacterium]